MLHDIVDLLREIAQHLTGVTFLDEVPKLDMKMLVMDAMQTIISENKAEIDEANRLEESKKAKERLAIADGVSPLPIAQNSIKGRHIATGGLRTVPTVTKDSA